MRAPTPVPCFDLLQNRAFSSLNENQSIFMYISAEMISPGGRGWSHWFPASKSHGKQWDFLPNKDERNGSDAGILLFYNFLFVLLLIAQWPPPPSTICRGKRSGGKGGGGNSSAALAFLFLFFFASDFLHLLPLAKTAKGVLAPNAWHLPYCYENQGGGVKTCSPPPQPTARVCQDSPPPKLVIHKSVKAPSVSDSLSSVCKQTRVAAAAGA